MFVFVWDVIFTPSVVVECGGEKGLATGFGGIIAKAEIDRMMTVGNMYRREEDL